MSPKISVLVSTYNWPKALRLVLLALNQQTFTDFEVIVTDDGSTDETKQMLESLKPHLNYTLTHLWQEDKGFRAARARNLGINEAKGDYIIFLDGDCIPCKTFIAMHHYLAEKGHFVVGNRVLSSKDYAKEIVNKQLSLVNKGFSYWQECKKQKKINKYLSFFILKGQWYRKLAPKQWENAQTCNLAVWKADLIAINGLDEAFQGWGYEDSDLVIRLIRHGIKRKSGKFAVPVIHLWHKETKRTKESENFKRLQEILVSTTVKAVCGLEQ